MSQRHPNPLSEFSHRLAQIKFIIFEIVIFVGFLSFATTLGVLRPLRLTIMKSASGPRGTLWARRHRVRALSLRIMAIVDTRSVIAPQMLERLNGFWRAKICPVCGKNTWNAEEGIAELRFLSMAAFVVGGPVIPLVVVTCQTCGNTMLFNAMKLGWMPPSTRVPPSPTGGGQ